MLGTYGLSKGETQASLLGTASGMRNASKTLSWRGCGGVGEQIAMSGSVLIKHG